MDLAGFLARYKYLAMFGVLLLCGIGLPVPEEVTLILSGLAVGTGYPVAVYELPDATWSRAAHTGQR